MKVYPEYEKWRKILRKLTNLINTQKYLMDEGRKAYRYFWFLDEKVSKEFKKVREELMGDERGEINFNDWFIHDAMIGKGMTLIDIAIKEGIFTEDEMEIVERMDESHYSLYQVERVEPKEGFVARDLLKESVYYVKEKKASESLVKWDILGIRLIKLDGLYRMTGALYIFRPVDRGAIIKAIKNDFDDVRKFLPIRDISQYLKLRGGEVLNYSFIASNSMKTILHNTDGEPLILSRADYVIMDYNKVISALRSTKELIEIKKDSFEWLSPSNTVIAFIKLEKGKLIIECNSRERLARTKKILKNVLKYCKFVENKFENLSETIGNKRILDFFIDGPLNKMEERLLIDSFHKQILEWLDTKIPVFGGLTPREAAKSEKEREKLIDIIKDIENYHERRKKLGRVFYDISWIWEELGLKEYLYLKQ